VCLCVYWQGQGVGVRSRCHLSSRPYNMSALYVPFKAQRLRPDTNTYHILLGYDTYLSYFHIYLNNSVLWLRPNCSNTQQIPTPHLALNASTCKMCGGGDWSLTQAQNNGASAAGRQNASCWGCGGCLVCGCGEQP
jgi:hypothetical protein